MMIVCLQKYVKYVRNLIAITACGDYCCLATKADEVLGQVSYCRTMGWDQFDIGESDPSVFQLGKFLVKVFLRAVPLKYKG